MDLARIRPVLLAFLAGCATGVPAGMVVWGDLPQPRVEGPKRAIIRNALLPSELLGSERAWVPYVPPVVPFGGGTWGSGPYGGAPPLEEIVQALQQRHRVTWTITCDCFDQTDSGTAQAILETVRSALYFDTAVDFLLAADVTVVGDGPIVPAPFVVDARAYSRASFDVTLYVSTTTLDAAPIPWIEFVELTQV